MKQSSPSPKATVQLEILLSDSCEILGGNECRMCRLLYVGFSTRWICRSQSSQAHQPSGYSSLNKHKSNQFETTWSHSTFFLFFAFCFHFVSIFPFCHCKRFPKMLQDAPRFLPGSFRFSLWWFCRDCRSRSGALLFNSFRFFFMFCVFSIVRFSKYYFRFFRILAEFFFL